jgi:transcriptional regulator with XRE-family HTH domain
MRFTEIGQQLRAYRLESGMRAEQIAAQLGVSRAALYRYEKGDVIKLDTIQRLSEMLKISPLSLLGIGIEYYMRPLAFQERLRQLEENCDQILMVGGAIGYLTATAGFDSTLAAAFDQGTAERPGRPAVIEQVQGILATRRRQYAQRRPGIIDILYASDVMSFLRLGVAPGLPLDARARRHARLAAAAEIEAIAGLMDAEPMGLQFGLAGAREPVGNFVLLRTRDRATVVMNPFRADALLDESLGVAMVTTAEEAIAAHQRIAETMWREAAKGAAGASELRAMLAAAPPD